MEELSENDLLLIDKYLLGQLSLEEQKDFDVRMSNDLFAQEVSSMRAAQLILKKKGEEKFRAEFSQIDVEMDKNSTISKPPKTLPSLKWIIGIALLALLVYLLSLLFFQEKPQNDILFAEYFEPMPNMVAPIEKNNTSPGTYDMAFQSYERGNYQEAIRLFENLDNRSDAVVFYQGLSFLGMDQANDAIPFLEQISPLPNSDFSDAAQWYLLLSYLYIDNSEMVTKVGKIILDKPGHRYRLETEELMKKMQ